MLLCGVGIKPIGVNETKLDNKDAGGGKKTKPSYFMQYALELTHESELLPYVLIE